MREQQADERHAIYKHSELALFAEGNSLDGTFSSARDPAGNPCLLAPKKTRIA